MVDIYNNLPQNVVDAGSVTDFQHLLTDIARERLRQGIQLWFMSFCARRGPEVM
jgi:hypothetical protein